jgi:hypothetical protein
MMGLSEIRAASRRAARQSRAQGKLPWLPTTAQRTELLAGKTLDQIGANIPFIGDRVPRGYKLHETLFIDISGFGMDNEPALSMQRLSQKIALDLPTIAYALVDVGQFQGHLGRFERRAVPIARSVRSEC